MSNTCPTINPARVKQVQDAIKYMNENQSKDAMNLPGNLIACMSNELNYAIAPLEDLNSANTSVPNIVIDDTVNLLKSIFSDMFQDNNGNSANETEFVNLAVKMVYAITNHLENSTANQTDPNQTDPRVEELNGGMPYRTRSSSKKRSKAKPEAAAEQAAAEQAEYLLKLGVA